MAEEKEGSGGFVKLISSEEHEFYIDRKAAMTSGTIKAQVSLKSLARAATTPTARATTAL